MPEAAVLIALTRDEMNPEIIFTRRSTHMNTHSGEVAFPGGKRDPEDITLEATALRESHEEIGLQPGEVEILGAGNDVISRFGLRVRPFIGTVSPDVQLVANTDELDRIFRVPVRYFLDQNQIRTDQIAYKHKTYQVPAWQYGEYHIWGLSAIMLAEFLNFGVGADITL